MASAKTYTARNTRTNYKDEHVGTVPQNILARVLAEYSDAVIRCEKVGLSPYRWEPQHSQEKQRIDEMGGVPIDPQVMAQKVKEHGTSNSARVTLDGDTQVISFKVLITRYEVEIDTDQLRFEE